MSAVEPSAVSNDPVTDSGARCGDPASHEQTATAWSRPVATGIPDRSPIPSMAVPYPKRGSTDHRNRTAPDTPSTRRASSRNGTRPLPVGNVNASVTRALPPSVTKVVSRTFVSGTYRRRASEGPSGASSNRPPRRASSKDANMVGESTYGTGSHATVPSSDTIATVRPSPMAARSRIGG